MRRAFRAETVRDHGHSDNANDRGVAMPTARRSTQDRLAAGTWRYGRRKSSNVRAEIAK